jgi:hypothetical protein
MTDHILTRVTWPILVAACIGGAAKGGETVVLNPGDSIQAAVDMHPGATFVFNPGVYRLQTIVPRTGQTFAGEPGAILSGAKVLTEWQRDRGRWHVSGQTQKGEVTAFNCTEARPRCNYPEELFIDDVRIRHVAALSEVGPGTWFFDYSADRIYIGDDPEGHVVETSVASYAFYGNRSRVTVRNLTVEKYANRTQHGAIHPRIGFAEPPEAGDLSYGWLIENVEVRLNHGAGIQLANDMTVRRSRIIRQGQIGIRGAGTNNVLIEQNELAYNNDAGYDWGFEGGATKVLQSNNTVFRSNYVHHNFGAGLWLDWDNHNSLIEMNFVEHNNNPGIFQECNAQGVVRYNISRFNAAGKSSAPWLWGAQILIAGSQQMQVYGNTVTVSADGGNGITLIQQDRGNASFGPLILKDNHVHDNVIIYQGAAGFSGAAADWNAQAMFNNRFDNNTYHVTDAQAPHWYWQAGATNFAGFRRQGQEPSGQLAVSPGKPSVPVK